MADSPSPVPGFELPRLLGCWYILFTTHAFWRDRSHPHLELRELPPQPDGVPRLTHALRFRDRGLLGNPRSREIHGIDHSESPGRFVWHSTRRIGGQRPWTVLDLAQPGPRAYDWAVLWSETTSLGTPPGLDIITRAPSLSQTLLDQIVSRVHDHSFLGEKTCAQLFSTVQDWCPPAPYRLR